MYCLSLVVTTPNQLTRRKVCLIYQEDECPQRLADGLQTVKACPACAVLLTEIESEPRLLLCVWL